MIRPRIPHCKFRRKFHLWLALGALLSAAACTQPPELDATIPDHLRDAAYPDLVPLDKAFATTRLPQDQAMEIERSLLARRDRLQARARALNIPLADANSRQPTQDEGKR